MEGWFEVCENRGIPQNSKPSDGKNTVNTVVAIAVPTLFRAATHEDLDLFNDLVISNLNKTKHRLKP